MADHSAPPPVSLRRRLLLFLLIPVGGLLLLDAIITYGVALAYSNRVHDSDLSEDAAALAQMLVRQPSDVLSPQARFLLEYDTDGPNYFAVTDHRRGVLARNQHIPQPAAPPPGAPPALYDTRVGKRSLRAAIVSLHPLADPTDTITVVLAETLTDRHRRAREILLLAIPLQALLMLGVLSLVWFGVSYGLRVLQPLTARLAAREPELTPIGEADVPREILPLTRTIDALFARLRHMLALQERFIADAAHQLRTPLTGLGLHVERALSAGSDDTLRDALGHIRQLTGRVTRTSTQLLAMTRAQAPTTEPDAMVPVDLATLVPAVIAERVHEGLMADIDLGYHGPPPPLHVLGDATSLQELLDNLIDNSLRYAGRSSVVTVSLRVVEGGEIELRVEDNGPGVPQELIPRLGERFFRAPGSSEDGTGLGLAIVQRIAERHRATVCYRQASPSGLQVAVRFHAMQRNT